MDCEAMKPTPLPPGATQELIEPATVQLPEGITLSEPPDCAVVTNNPNVGIPVTDLYWDGSEEERNRLYAEADAALLGIGADSVVGMDGSYGRYLRTSDELTVSIETNPALGGYFRVTLFG